MKKVDFLLFISSILFTWSCSSGQQPQFGKTPLHLDNFGLNLDVETFFADESIFRNNDKYSVSADERTIALRDGDSTLKIVQYAVTSSPAADTLARYQDFYFHNLEVIMDHDDKETFMVAAAQENVRPGQVDTLIKEIGREYGSAIFTERAKASGNITYQWKKDNKIAELVLDIQNPLSGIAIDGPSGDPNKLFADEYHKEKVISVNLFITSPRFSHYVENATTTNGLLTRY